MKKTVVSIALGIVLGIGGFLGYNHLNPTFVSTSNLPIPYTLDDLVQESDLIVRVQLQDNVSQVLEKDDQGLPYDYYTFSTVKVLQSVKGDPEETLTVVEPYAVWRQVDGAQILSTGGYQPLKSRGVYLLFLTKSTHHPETYEVVGGLQGKFLMTPSGEADPNVPMAGDHYKNLHEDVMERFVR